MRHSLNTLEAIPLTSTLAQQPRQKQKIQFFKPSLTRNELKSVLECMFSDQISFGKVVQNYEKEIAKFLDFAYSLTTISLSSAYHLVFLGLDIQKGDEIIISATSSIILLDVIHHVGATPVIVDTEPNYFHPNIENLIQHITPKTKSILINYPFGAYKNYNDLAEHIKGKKNISLIEDISYITGTQINDQHIGHHADITILGLHKDTLMTMGKGAVLLTNSKNYYSIMKDLRQQGGSIPYKVRYDYTITDYQAAMGLEQLNTLPLILERRKKIGYKYLETIQSNDYFTSYFKYPQIDVYAHFPIIISGNVDNFLKYLHHFNIEAQRILNHKPVHALLQSNENHSEKYKNINKLYQKSVLIPIYPNLTASNIKYIIQSLLSYIEV